MHADSPSPTSICDYQSRCSGCSYWGIPLSAQINHKTDGLRQEWDSIGLGLCPEIEVFSLADRGLRDRLDFRWQDGRFGLFDRNRDEVVDLESCLQLSPRLASWLTDFRAREFAFKKATIRLRVSPEGRRGVWLDLPNEDVKELIEDGVLLRQLLEMAVVEIGQRRKHLYVDETDGRLRLAKDPHFETWTRTWSDGRPLQLWSRIADFSQAGDAINQMLVGAVARHFANENVVLDWGAGSGNLSLPALPHAREVWALDHDEFALMGLRRTQEAAGLTQLRIERMDFHKVGVFEELTRKASQRFEQESQTWIVDPPRSGAGALFFEVPDAVTKIVSVSCFQQSFLQDSFELTRQGFRCESLALVDQFPQTHHGEWVSKWTR
ncbi:MAG: hypothetical protein KF767_16070 [Bdellovibrionaceae bacterium]|nr:hypothetical protein [Pseudobdellovibrionaceae bacterium]